MNFTEKNKFETISYKTYNSQFEEYQFSDILAINFFSLINPTIKKDLIEILDYAIELKLERLDICIEKLILFSNKGNISFYEKLNVGIDKNFIIRVNTVDDQWVEYKENFIKFVGCYHPEFEDYEHGFKIHIKLKQDNKRLEELPVSILKIEVRFVEFKLSKYVTS